MNKLLTIALKEHAYRLNACRDLQENILMLFAIHTGIKMRKDETIFNYLARLQFAGFERDELDELIDADFIFKHIYPDERND